jgi:hypothetical protein
VYLCNVCVHGFLVDVPLLVNLLYDPEGVTINE